MNELIKELIRIMFYVYSNVYEITTIKCNSCAQAPTNFLRIYNCIITLFCAINENCSTSMFGMQELPEI